jgi:hypothetical protein
MSLKQAIAMFDLLDDPAASGATVNAYFQREYGHIGTVTTVDGPKSGSTDFVKFVIPGSQGRLKGDKAPTLGIIGRLGGIGVRPAALGLVSDADGALTALTAAACILESKRKGDVLAGDIIVCTHICPNAGTKPHDPVPRMDSPVDTLTMNKVEVCAEMEAILSIDTTRGNRLLNHRGIAISPTVKEGYVLRVSNDLLFILQNVTGELPYVLPITTLDITPYNNGLYHINSIMQPCVVTTAPVVGVGITSQAAVSGCATGASQEVDVALAARFTVEVAKAFGSGKAQFYDSEEFGRLIDLYGSMSRLQILGRD